MYGLKTHFGMSGSIRGVGSVRGVLGAFRDCRYSGARRGIGALGALGAPRGEQGVVTVLRVSGEHQRD